MKNRKKQSGFTLIELLIVVIIVAVLAAVGVPLLRGNVERAKMSEADAGLGTIRTSLRAELAENGAYPTQANYGLVAPNLIGIQDGDLTGRYFDDNDYQFKTDNSATPVPTYCIKVVGDGTGATTATTAPRASEVNTKKRSMNQDGTIFDNNDNCGVAVST